MDKDIRDRLQDVFGNYSDFCNRISNNPNMLSSSVYGVLQTPPTPMGNSRAPPFPPLSQSPMPTPSARECVSVMSDLVPYSPLQPPQLSIFHRDPLHSSNPASSTRSSPDDAEALKKKKRKHRNPDSDSEVEKRKRHKEHSELSKPSTSREKPQDDDAMKELFGDDMAKPSGSEKGVSPDSGVHSTENDGNEENDITSIINTMSSLLPMLSPVTERPLDKQSTRDKEKDRKDREEKRRKEQEMRAAREEKAREEARKRLEEEKKVAAEEKERKAAEERERRAAEEERERKAAEERRLAEERKERQRKEEEKLRKEEERQRKEEERQRREEEAAAAAALAEKERLRQERMAAASPLAEASNRLTGILPLHLLSSEKMSKLVDLGRKSGKIETKAERPKSPMVTAEVVKKKRNRDETNGENVKKSKKDKAEAAESSTERPISPLVTAETVKKRRELDEPLVAKRVSKAAKMDLKVEPGSSAERPQSPLVTSETVKKRRDRDEGNGTPKSGTPKKSAKNELKVEAGESSASPRPGSSMSSGGKDFRCACNEVLPVKPSRPNIPAERPDEQLQNHAKSLKRKADQTTDHVKKVLLYLDSIVYFALGAKFLPQVEKAGSRKASIFRDTADLAKQTTSRFAHSESLTPLQQHFVSRVRSLSIRAQAILAFNLYQSKASNVLKSFHVLEQHESSIVTTRGDDGPAADARSPGSVHSASNHSSNSSVTMPLETYQLMKSQMKIFHSVMWAHKLWADAGYQTHKSQTDTLFINSLENVCGSMCVTTPIEKASQFFLTGITWLRDEYELELKRPPPPPSTPVAAKK